MDTLFGEILSGTKFLNNNFMHNLFTYKIGLNIDGNSIRLVNVQYSIKNHKFKADMVDVKYVIKFKDIINMFWISIVRRDYSALAYVKNQTEEICKLAVQQNDLFLYQFK